MRARYRARDVLSVPTSAYTLNAVERARLFARIGWRTAPGRSIVRLQSWPSSVVTYRFGPFRLVPDQRRLERDGTAIALTPKAFDLLVTLVQHHTRALSKDEILALVWSGSVVEEGNLAQQVLLLRRALADAGDCVATVPRHGYRFVALRHRGAR